MLHTTHVFDKKNRRKIAKTCYALRHVIIIILLTKSFIQPHPQPQFSRCSIVCKLIYKLCTLLFSITAWAVAFEICPGWNPGAYHQYRSHRPSPRGTSIETNPTFNIGEELTTNQSTFINDVGFIWVHQVILSVEILAGVHYLAAFKTVSKICWQTQQSFIQ